MDKGIHRREARLAEEGKLGERLPFHPFISVISEPSRVGKTMYATQRELIEVAAFYGYCLIPLFVFCTLSLQELSCCIFHYEGQCRINE